MRSGKTTLDTDKHIFKKDSLVYCYNFEKNEKKRRRTRKGIRRKMKEKRGKKKKKKNENHV